MMDDGGSNRVIRDEFGLLPTSDIRQCIVALSEEKPSDLLRKLFTYRYNQGTGISGMTFGNLFMAGIIPGIILAMCVICGASSGSMQVIIERFIYLRTRSACARTPTSSTCTSTSSRLAR